MNEGFIAWEDYLVIEPAECSDCQEQLPVGSEALLFRVKLGHEDGIRRFVMCLECQEEVDYDEQG